MTANWQVLTSKVAAAISNNVIYINTSVLRLPLLSHGFFSKA